VSLLPNLFNSVSRPGLSMSYRYLIDSIIQESPEVRTYRMHPVFSEKRLQFIPGQFLHVVAPGKERSRENMRHMSIASHPDEPYVLISMDVSSESGFKQAFRTVREGDLVELYRIKGHFTLEPVSVDDHYVFIAGGVGITPFRSLILEMEKQNRLDACRLIHVGREHLYKDEHLLRLGDRAAFIGRPEVPSRMDEAALLYRKISPWYYICGSDGFIQDMRGHLLERQVPEERIRMEFFSH
jgi:ferredoxin-NADP reductase